MKTTLHRITYIVCCAAMITAATLAGKNHHNACSECNLAIGKKETALWTKLPSLYFNNRMS